MDWYKKGVGKYLVHLAATNKMKHNLLLIFATTLALLLFSCESGNIEDKYYSAENEGSPQDTIDSGKYSEIVWLPLNGNLNDTTGSNIPVFMAGNAQFVDGINTEHGKGLYLDGSSYLLINLGYYDTLSVVFWIKGESELEPANTPVLFDYGFSALAAQLDATTGATSLTVMKNENKINSYKDSSVEYLNTFSRYCFVYVEAGGGNTKVYFKGFSTIGDEIIFEGDFDLPGVIEAISDILYIGRSSKRENQSSTFFRGAIDEIHIYSKTLSGPEIENMALIPTN